LQIYVLVASFYIVNTAYLPVNEKTNDALDLAYTFLVNFKIESVSMEKTLNAVSEESSKGGELQVTKIS